MKENLFLIQFIINAFPMSLWSPSIKCSYFVNFGPVYSLIDNK